MVALEMLEHISATEPDAAADLEIRDDAILHPIVHRAVGDLEVVGDVLLLEELLFCGFPRLGIRACCFVLNVHTLRFA